MSGGLGYYFFRLFMVSSKVMVFRNYVYKVKEINKSFKCLVKLEIMDLFCKVRYSILVLVFFFILEWIFLIVLGIGRCKED